MYDFVWIGSLSCVFLLAVTALWIVLFWHCGFGLLFMFLSAAVLQCFGCYAWVDV